MLSLFQTYCDRMQQLGADTAVALESLRDVQQVGGRAGQRLLCNAEHREPRQRHLSCLALVTSLASVLALLPAAPLRADGNFWAQVRRSCTFCELRLNSQPGSRAQRLVPLHFALRVAAAAALMQQCS